MSVFGLINVRIDKWVKLIEIYEWCDIDNRFIILLKDIKCKFIILIL